MFRPRLTAKSYMILFLAVLAIWAGLQQDDFKSVLLQVLVSVVSAGVLDAAIIYIKDKKLIMPTSAVITGLIIAMVLAPQQAILYYITASCLAILSKHLLRLEKRHFLNPAGFGLLVVSLLFSATLSWWGLVNNWIIFLGGIVIAYKVKRLPAVIGYLFTISVLLSAYSLINKGGLLDYFSTINLFLVFIMLIEPKTSPLGNFPGLFYGGIVAMAGFLVYLFLPRYDFAVSGLAMANLMNIFFRRQKKK